MSMLTKAHDGNGLYTRTPAQIAQDNRAAEMRSMGMTYQQIGDSLGVSKQAAHAAVQRAIREIPTDGAEDVRRVELMKLDRLERFYHGVMNSTHVRVSASGKIVMQVGEDGTETPLLDDGPRMEAANGLLKIAAQRARLLGINAPVVTHNEVMIYDVERDSTLMIEAQILALKAIGLDDRVDEFRRVFVAALESGPGEVIDAEWTSA